MGELNIYSTKGENEWMSNTENSPIKRIFFLWFFVVPPLRKLLLSQPWMRSICGALMPVIILPVHISILWHFWQSYSRYVDKRFCSCSCWDTVFKGTYESGIASYKHLYFNATKNSMKMWILIVGGVIALYECNKYLIKLMVKRRARYDMVLLFLSSIFSHYYAWWAYLNYMNDDYYSQWNHQLFFTVSSSADLWFVSNKVVYDSLDYGARFNSSRSSFSQFGQSRIAKESIVYNWHCHSSHRGRWRRSIHFECDTGRRICTSGNSCIHKSFPTENNFMLNCRSFGIWALWFQTY